MDNKREKKILRKRKLRRRRRFVSFLLIITILVTLSLSRKFIFNNNNSYAQSSIEAYISLVSKDPLYSELTRTIEEYEEEIANKELEAYRESERLRLIEEAKKREEELKNQKIAYLTFDDGPSRKVTPRILDILDKNDIKATFFILAKVAEVNKDILIDTYERGHVIGNHSYSHDYKYLYKNIDNFVEDIKKADQVYKNILGEDFTTNLLRLPGGGHHRKAFVEHMEGLGYKVYDWNALNGDAEANGRTASQLIARLKETTFNQKQLVVLMHDTDAKSATADSLQEAIDFLKSKGYIFSTLDKYIENK